MRVATMPLEHTGWPDPEDHQGGDGLMTYFGDPRDFAGRCPTCGRCNCCGGSTWEFGRPWWGVVPPDDPVYWPNAPAPLRLSPHEHDSTGGFGTTSSTFEFPDGSD